MAAANPAIPEPITEQDLFNSLFLEFAIKPKHKPKHQVIDFTFVGYQLKKGPKRLLWALFSK